MKDSDPILKLRTLFCDHGELSLDKEFNSVSQTLEDGPCGLPTGLRPSDQVVK